MIVQWKPGKLHGQEHQLVEVQKTAGGTVGLRQGLTRTGPLPDGAHAQERKPVHHEEVLDALHLGQTVKDFIDRLLDEALEHRRALPLVHMLLPRECFTYLADRKSTRLNSSHV